MPSEDSVLMTGEVIEVLPSTTFRVKIDDEHTILAYMSGRMRKAKIRIILGDRVDLEVSPYDLTRGRIIYRYK
jgi:translation initiation factor IF-1